ncbi:MAG: hypothetical protein QF893_19520 [Alphaproteobacteria bacterium]|nr:hypothetical protein [Alphaproteobacteria bacterium]
MSVSLTADYQGFGGDGKRTASGIVLHLDKDNYAVLFLNNFRASYNSDTGPYAMFLKRQSGKNSKALFIQLRKSAPLGETPVQFRIEKRGFKYTGFVKLGSDGKWMKLGTHALLGKKLTPGIFATQDDEAVEAIIEFDRFEIEKVKK